MQKHDSHKFNKEKETYRNKTMKSSLKTLKKSKEMKEHTVFLNKKTFIILRLNIIKNISSPKFNIQI